MKLETENRCQTENAKKAPVRAWQKIRSCAYALLVVFFAFFCIGGCPPQIDSTNPPISGVPRGGGVTVTLQGLHFYSPAFGQLYIDAVPGGSFSDVSGSIGSTERDSSTMIVDLDAAPSAQLGTHTFVVANGLAAFLASGSFGVSNPVSFTVTCPTAGGPPPPSLAGYVDLLNPNLQNVTLHRGITYNLRFSGQNLQYSPALVVADSLNGVTIGAISGTDAAGAFVDVQVTVASDADTGVHLIKATTNSGCNAPQASNTLQLNVSPQPAPAPTITSVDQCLLPAGTTNIVVTGANFQFGDTVNVFAQNTAQMGTFNATISSSQTLFATITIPSPALYLTVSGTGVTSAPFPVNCGPLVPILTTLTPPHVTEAPDPVAYGVVYVRCDGVNFGANRKVLSSFANGFYINSLALPTVHADPDKVAVFTVGFPSGTGGSTSDIQIQNFNGDISNPQTLFIDSGPGPGMPFINAVLFQSGTQLHAGQGADGVIEGYNLQNATDIVPTNYSNPGLHFSITSPPASGQINFHVDADSTAALTGDEATNIQVRTPRGPSNPFGIEVLP